MPLTILTLTVRSAKSSCIPIQFLHMVNQDSSRSADRPPAAGSIGHATVYEYLKRAQAAGIGCPLAEGWDDRQLEAALFGPTPRRVYENRKPKNPRSAIA